jgi:hypothetical protein
MADRFQVSLDNDGAKMDFVVKNTPNGSRVVELKIICPSRHPTGVTTAMLRGITAGDLARTPTPSQQDELQRYVSALPTSKWVEGSRNSLSTEELKLLAVIYVEVLRLGGAPTKTIQDWLGCSRPTASRAIKQARDLGFLESPSRKGLPARSRSKSPRHD